MRLRLKDLAEDLEPRLRRQFLEAIESVHQASTLARIEEAIRNGNPEEAFRAARAGALSFSTAWSEAFTAAASVAGARIGLAFDRVNVRAVEAMRANQLRLVREISEGQRSLFREVLTEGVQAGINPRAIAREFRDAIGLTDRQYQAVANYRRLLERNNLSALTRQLRDRRFDGAFRRAVEDGGGLSARQIELMVSRYRDRYIKYRSEVVARTEALRAANEGSNQLFRQAVAEGTLERGQLERRWNTAKDERVRGTHARMHGQVRALDEPFTTGAGVALMFPGDPEGPPAETIQCRCVVSVDFKTSG